MSNYKTNKNITMIDDLPFLDDLENNTRNNNRCICIICKSVPHAVDRVLYISMSYVVRLVHLDIISLVMTSHRGLGAIASVYGHNKRVRFP